MKTITFNKESSGRWYVLLPDYPGPKADLQMVAGADTMLDIIAGGSSDCTLLVDESSFQGAEELKLLNAYHGEHGDYILEYYRGEKTDHKMWLCPVIKYVFGHLPERIFFKGQKPSR